MGVTPSDQLWFFLKEDMALQTFVQKQYKLSDVKKNGITFQDCLDILGIEAEAKSFAFYLHSATMAAAVRLLTNESILVTYNLYCQKDPVVTILIRGINEPSPNTSRAPSHHNSLTERRKISRGVLVPEIFIQPAPRHVSGTVDVATMETIEDKSTMITIDNGNGDCVTSTKNYLLCWIDSQLGDGKYLTDIVVQSFGTRGFMRKVQLTPEIWQRSLIRGPWRNHFLPLWNEYYSTESARQAIIAELSQEAPNFTQSCQNFIHDLRSLKDRKALARLKSTGHAFFLGKPYFDNDTVGKILIIPTKNGTLEDDLNALAKKGSEGGYVCTAHTVSPLYERVLGVEWDKVGEESVSLHHQMNGRSLEKPEPKAKQLAKKGNKFLKDTFKGCPKGGNIGSGNRDDKGQTGY